MGLPEKVVKKSKHAGTARPTNHHALAHSRESVGEATYSLSTSHVGSPLLQDSACHV